MVGKLSDNALNDLLQRDNVIDRMLVPVSDLSLEAETFLHSVDTLVEHELKILALEGKKYSDGFWAESEQAKLEKLANCYIGTRVRLLKGTVSLEWYRNTTRPAMGEGKPKQVFSKYLPRGASARYPTRYFEREPQWAKNAITFVEDGYEKIRKRVEVLQNIRREMRKYEKLVASAYSDVQESENE